MPGTEFNLLIVITLLVAIPVAIAIAFALTPRHPASLAVRSSPAR